MGWLSATGIVQYLHRRLAQLSTAVPKNLELRRDRPPPSDISFSCPRFYQIYIDNFDEALTSKTTPTMESYAVRVRATGETLGVSYDNGEKRAVMKPVGKHWEHMWKAEEESRGRCENVRPSSWA